MRVTDYITLNHHLKSDDPIGIMVLEKAYNKFISHNLKI